jgi:gamma-glutamyltranspeptidase/glutathione hydrolase
MVTAPHHLAAAAGLRVLADGGNAIEAMVAAAATIAVVYPHMNGLGGDNFWLLHTPHRAPLAIASCGAAAARATPAFYRAAGYAAIPARGPHAALTVAGAVAGWQEALHVSQAWGGRLPLTRLLEDAIEHAREGVPATRSQVDNTVAKAAELTDVSGFDACYRPQGAAPAVGALFKQPALAATLTRLAQAGLDDFYRGELARAIADDLARAGSPLALTDLAQHRAQRVTPLKVICDGHTLYNLPPPTQGLASLLLLAIYARVPADTVDGFDYVHRLVEATKQAFLIRDAEITDPAYMRRAAAEWLSEACIAACVARIDRRRAAPWPTPPPTGGDTVWLAAADRAGRMVSFIQSIYWEFGSGVVLPQSGVCWQNRGTSFSLDHTAVNPLRPGRLPFHTIQPALAELADGRVMAYGTMGGDGQPQTQAAVFTRHVTYGVDLQAAVNAPRWLLGRTWGAATTTLKLESRCDDALVAALRSAGHAVEMVAPYSAQMGHAGAIVRTPDGTLAGASDPRSDGAVAAF